MMSEDENFELEAIAKAFRTISKETSYAGLAEAVLQAALLYSGAARGAVLLSEGGELLAKADASFPRERAKVFASHPPAAELRLQAELRDRVLTRQETVVSHGCWMRSALVGPASCRPEREIALLCLPLIHYERTIGVLYLEAVRAHALFTPRCVMVMSMLASQAAVSFESVQLFDALRETNMWMIKGQQIGRMGSYRWNTRTLLSRGSRECYRIFDIDLNINPVPFQTFRDRIHPDDLPALERSLAQALSTQSPFSHEYRVVHRDGTILHVIAVGQFDFGPSGDLELEGIITDITERKATEQALTDAQSELARAARLASLGELAGSIIHEVSQPMTSIIASAEACLRWLARDPAELDEARKSVMRVIEQGLRACSVVSGLRSLVRGGQLEFASVQINEAVEEVLLLLKRELGRAGITVTTDFDPSIPAIEADKVQIQQVVLNLVRNAIDAMADPVGADPVGAYPGGAYPGGAYPGGRACILDVSSKCVDGHALVAIADTGGGVDLMVGERLFDALYTTKEDGLGLGLSICRKIINAHGGRLWMEQNTKQGATFTFLVPIRRPGRGLEKRSEKRSENWPEHKYRCSKNK
jgi:signal transduction histidine kinase